MGLSPFFQMLMLSQLENSLFYQKILSIEPFRGKINRSIRFISILHFSNNGIEPTCILQASADIWYDWEQENTLWHGFRFIWHVWATRKARTRARDTPRHTTPRYYQENHSIRFIQEGVQSVYKGDTRVPADNGQLFFVGAIIGNQTEFWAGSL
jgi:hypothetical protein